MKFIINHLRRLWLAHLAVVLYAVSLALPSVCIFDNYVAGYLVAWATEEGVFRNAEKLVEHVLGQGPPNQSPWSSALPFHLGAAANHAFFLSYIAAIFWRPRVATLLAGIAVLCAVGCLLPSQIANLHDGWILGPGYFLWCTATIVLLAATIGQWRRMRFGSLVPRFPHSPLLHSGASDGLQRARVAVAGSL